LNSKKAIIVLSSQFFDRGTISANQHNLSHGKISIWDCIWRSRWID